MKKIILLYILLFAPIFAHSQTNQYYIYNIVSFEGNFEREGIKLKIDDGKSVEKLKDSNGLRIKFKTPAAVLMHFISEGWEMYHIGSTSHGSSYNGSGRSSSTAYWIFRKPCTREEFDNAVKNGIIQQYNDKKQ